MPIDLAQVDWLYVALLAVFVFLTTLVGSLLSFGHRWTASTLSALLFAALFVFWTYYPHRVPLPKTISVPSAAPASTAAPAPAAPAAPAAPQRPRNPVTDITPPASPPTSPAPAAPATPPAGSTR
ncbi:MAG TPA: hypothetical protein VIY07_15625 [Pseudolabrys sp.]|jgi:hypothetical protein